MTLKFLGFIIVSANRSAFVPREQCFANRAFREFFAFPPYCRHALPPFRSRRGLEPIRMIRIIRRISRRTSFYLCICGSTRRRAGPATRSSLRCSGTVASNTPRTHSEKEGEGKNRFLLRMVKGEFTLDSHACYMSRRKCA